MLFMRETHWSQAEISAPVAEEPRDAAYHLKRFSLWNDCSREDFTFYFKQVYSQIVFSFSTGLNYEGS